MPRVSSLQLNIDNVPQALRAARRRPVLVMPKGCPDTGASFPLLQEVGERAAGTLESSRAGSQLVSGKVQARANIRAVFLEKCDHAVLDFLAATVVGKFPRR
jgi:hypothetical protein